MLRTEGTHLPEGIVPDLIQAGWPDLDAMRPLRPGTLTLLDAPRATGLVPLLLADAAIQGRLVAVADGCNSLDVYDLARAGRRRAVARVPQASRRDLVAFEDLVLDRVRVARGFTVHQLQAIVEDGLAAEVERGIDAGLAPGLLAAPGLLEMSLDADVQPSEARVLAARALDALRRLARRHDVPVLITGGTLRPGVAHPLRQLLEETADESVHIRPQRVGLVVDFPRRGARFVLPGMGQRRIEDYAPDAIHARPIPPAPVPTPEGASYSRGRFWGPRYPTTVRAAGA